jgi:predicted SPOUT superfamily RNA methylase MTH1
MRANDEALYREGVVVKKHSKEGKGSYVNVGIMKVCIPCCVPPRLHVYI